jgi:hypothetical protein
MFPYFAALGRFALSAVHRLVSYQSLTPFSSLGLTRLVGSHRPITLLQPIADDVRTGEVVEKTADIAPCAVLM